MNGLRDTLNIIIRRYQSGTMTDMEDVVRACNDALDNFHNFKLYSRRDRSKEVMGFRRSTVDDKIIVRYSTGSGTMMLKNLMKNLISIEQDAWEDEDGEHEHNMLLQRLGIRV